jgi:hypothetical protein
MKKKILLSLGLAFLAGVSFSQNPVAENGQLQVIGHQLCNEQGKSLQLRGISMFGLMHMPECLTYNSFKTLKEDWNSNVVRIPVYCANYSNSNNYNQNPEWNNTLIDSIVNWSERLGIYCIIDWHNDRYGSPNDINHKGADAFFSLMSHKYAGKKNIIYEIFNEPYKELITWDTIAQYANRIIPIIRKNDPKAIILVPTPNWDQKLETVDTKKLNDNKNLMFTFHFYAASHKSLYPLFEEQIHRIPVFVSEWGTCESSGMGILDTATSSRFLSTMRKHVSNGDTVSISWCNFSYGDKAESTSALKPLSCADGLWNNTTGGGDFIKHWIMYNSAPEFFSASLQYPEPILDNDTLLLKLDLSRGGAISYISLSGSERNIVNIADEGRYIQQSYYAGQRTDRKSEGQSASWSPWSWNPIQVGDAYRNKAKILSFKKTGNTMYIKCNPMLWDMKNQPAEAEMEQWTSLNGNVIKVRNRLSCHRTDSIYLEGILNDQELPAVYPVSALKNLYTYFGDKPFTNDALSKPVTENLSGGFWGRYGNDTVTENWMAYVDDAKWGIGVYNPLCSNFLAGMFLEPGGEANSNSTSYIAPVKKEIINKNSVYEYEYYLIVGEIEEIRSKIYLIHSSNNFVSFKPNCYYGP